MKLVKVLVFIIIVIIFLYIQNNMLTVTNIKYKSSRLPQSFNGYRIAQLSDLHGKEYGKNNWLLITIMKFLKPDLIVITGDLINLDYSGDNSIVLFVSRLNKIAPVYIVTGNHEVACKHYKILAERLRTEGIKVLENTTEKVERGGSHILVIGINDPITTVLAESSFIHEYLKSEIDKAIDKNNTADFKILLSHRPEKFDLYVEYKMDLIFTGHAHGGQVRLPFLGGIYAPYQGLFPEYTSGKYSNGNSTMIVSRGLSNSSFPLRLFNRPEIIITTLLKGT